MHSHQRLASRASSSSARLVLLRRPAAQQRRVAVRGSDDEAAPAAVTGSLFELTKDNFWCAWDVPERWVDQCQTRHRHPLLGTAASRKQQRGHACMPTDQHPARIHFQATTGAWPGGVPVHAHCQLGTRLQQHVACTAERIATPLGVCVCAGSTSRGTSRRASWW